MAVPEKKKRPPEEDWLEEMENDQDDDNESFLKPKKGKNADDWLKSV